MVDPHLWKQWKVCTALLADARRYLVEAAPHLQHEGLSELAQFEEYLQHNELGLALEELAELGKAHPCRGGFWRDLERAAEAMKLPDRAEEYRKAFLSVVSGNNVG